VNAIAAGEAYKKLKTVTLNFFEPHLPLSTISETLGQPIVQSCNT